MNTSTEWTVLAVLKWIGAAAVAHWLGMSSAIQALLGLMLLDFATGVISGICQKELSSRTASLGIRRKAGTLIIIIAVHVVSDMAGNHFAMPVDLGNVVAWFYVLTEMISIVENGGRLGAPVPPYLLEAIKRAKKLQETQDQAIADIKQNQDIAVESLAVAQKATDTLVKTLPKAP